MRTISTLGLALGLGLAATIPAKGSEEISCTTIPAYYHPDQKVSTELCAELKAKSDSDYISIDISFKPPTADSQSQPPKQYPIKDTVPPAEDTTSGTPYYVEYTQHLFNNYDLRDPRQPSRRLPVPSEMSHYHYDILATKETILQIIQEPYILVIHIWDRQTAGMNIKKPLRLQKPDKGAVIFNANGRRNSSAAGFTSSQLHFN